MKGTGAFFTMLWFAGLSMLGFIATDMYLPAFESMRVNLGTEASWIGMSLTVFLLGIALGQLVYGPLSDRFGRIKILLAGLTLYSAASLACALTPSIDVLLVARFFQALGACSATVIWQAIVIDRYDDRGSERVFATIMPLVALSPALAPLLGAVLDSQLGWRSIFVCLVALGVVLIMASLTQTDSMPSQHQQAPANTADGLLVTLARHYRQLLSSNAFIGNMLIFSGCSAAFFAWLTGSPFVMANMGYSGTDIGLSYIPQTIAFIIGGYGCRALLNRFNNHQLLRLFSGVFVLGITIICLLSWTLTISSIWLILLPFCLVALANGAMYPLVVNQALSGFKHCSATAAGLLNFLQSVICFIASAAVSSLAYLELMAVTSTMLVAMVMVITGIVIATHRAKSPLAIEAQ